MEQTSATDNRGNRSRSLSEIFDPEELRRRNPVSLGMDVLILMTTGFLAILFTMGMWPAAIGAVPIAALLYFGYASSIAFFISQVLAIVAILLATVVGILPY